MAPEPVAKFISRWSNASAAERAKSADVEEILKTLVALSRAHESDTPGTYLR